MNDRELAEALGVVPAVVPMLRRRARQRRLPVNVETLRAMKGRVRGRAVTYLVDGREYGTKELSKLLFTVPQNVHHRVMRHLRVFPGEPLSMARLKLRDLS